MAVCARSILRKLEEGLRGFTESQAEMRFPSEIKQSFDALAMKW